MYIVQHYNRPYFLELHLQLLHHFFPKKLIVVVADDGSSIDIQRHIKDFPANHIYISKQHVGRRNGSRGETLAAAAALTDDRFLVCAEDDFLPSPFKLPFDQYSAMSGNPEYPDQDYLDWIAAAQLVLENHEDVRVVQLARGVDYEYHHATTKNLLPGSEFECGGIMWRRLKRSTFEQYYFCNWPYMIRRSDFNLLGLSFGLGMVRMELHIGQKLDSMFAKKCANYIVIPDYPRYVHCGAGVSQQTYNTRRMDLFLTSFQERMFGKVVYPNKHGLGNRLAQLWCAGKFSILFEEVLEHGFEKAMRFALARALPHL